MRHKSHNLLCRSSGFLMRTPRNVVSPARDGTEPIFDQTNSTLKRISSCMMPINTLLFKALNPEQDHCIVPLCVHSMSR